MKPSIRKQDGRHDLKLKIAWMVPGAILLGLLADMVAVFAAGGWWGLVSVLEAMVMMWLLPRSVDWLCRMTLEREP